MKRIKSGFLFPLFALFLLVYSLSIQMFSVPPLGKLFDPFSGIVQNREDGGWNVSLSSINTNGVLDSVQVFFDDRMVPHIYAANTEDLFFAQGYVTARLRLWQMDFMSYVAAGRLSELLNKPATLDYDRNIRRMGIPEAARQSLVLIEKNPETKKILTAYTKGVNAYINTLQYKDLPFEYKLMDYKPEPWSNLKSVLVMKQIANTLSGREDDLAMSKLMLLLGESDFNELYPLFEDHINPIMNTKDSEQGANPAFVIKKPSYLNYSFLSSNNIISRSKYNPSLGSNSWVVSGKKTRSGYPILACDPHLSLSLPCVWIEMQLSAPGLNVYGVSIPGTPAVIIGFNQDIAWGITNGADDVKDWYKLKLSEDYKKYQLDGKWCDTKYRIEKIKRRGRQTFYDTIFYTAQGPIVFNKSFPGDDPDLMNYALKWQLHQPSNEFFSFIQLNKAKDYRTFKAAIADYSCPSLNFSFAGKDNTIAIYHQGKFPVKWPGQGMFLLDGTSSAHISSRYIPEDSLPNLLDPSCQYVFSANQHPTNAGYSYFYNGYYAENRAARIHELLEANNRFDIASIQRMQLDDTSSFALEALPVLVNNVEANKLNAGQTGVLNTLKLWKGNYDENDSNARLFELWVKNIRDFTWDEIDNQKVDLPTPKDHILLHLIQQDPDNTYFDNKSTVEIENAADIITRSFLLAANEYTKLKKEGSINWSDYNKVNLTHLAKIKALSVLEVPAAGYAQTINAMSKNWGPSWRMIVELGEEPKGYGIYPGGQSGNPGSIYYDNFITDWNKGKYNALNFYATKAQAKSQSKICWILK